MLFSYHWGDNVGDRASIYDRERPLGYEGKIIKLMRKLKHGNFRRLDLDTQCKLGHILFL